MNIGKTLYITKRREWRKWLSENYDKEKEIWLIYYKKESGKQRISYDDAVLESLCFGWIDSIVKGIDKEKFAQRFSPRKNTSVLSQLNLERIRKLIKEGIMTEIGLKALAHVYDPKNDKVDEFIFPDGILKAIKKNQKAWENFQKLPESYKRVRVAYIESRKRHGTGMYQSALKNFIKAAEKNKRIGITKEKKYGK